MLKGLQNYFFGKDIFDYYQERIKSHPEQTKRLRKERNNYIIYGKILTNIVTGFGIGLGVAGIIGGSWPNAVESGVIIAIGESGRSWTNEDFRFRKTDYAVKDCCEEVDKLCEKLNRLSIPENLEKIVNSLEKKI